MIIIENHSPQNPHMDPNDPMAYMVRQCKAQGIEMHCLCDGQVLYDQQLHRSFHSSECPYIDEQMPHVIYRSLPRNDRRLSITEQPDFDAVANLPDADDQRIIVPSLYTFRLTEELQDIHKSDGLYLCQARPDATIVRTHSIGDRPATGDARVWVDFLIHKFMEA